MSFSDEARSRILTEGWCPRGESFPEALSHATPGSTRETQDAFAAVGSGEPVAALLLHAFTGARPVVGDDQSGGGSGRNGAADIILQRNDGLVEIVEVTRSLDAKYQRSQAHTRRFEAAVEREYLGSVAWQLDLERGWESADLNEVAQAVAAELNRLVGLGATTEGMLDVHPVVRAGVIGPMDPPRVIVISANAGASNAEAPYLTELSGYLANDPIIAKKLAKLERECEEYGAARTHLFIHMAATGTRGGLLPTSPSYFTWGEFRAPEVLTDLWLDGNTGHLFHWTVESGWIFHVTSG